MRIVLIALLVLLLVPSWSTGERIPLLGKGEEMSLRPVALEDGVAAAWTAGALTLLGIWELDSPDPVFGGFSAMRVDGDRFTLLSDNANLVSFRLKDGRASAVRFGALPGGPGTGWTKIDRDSEAMACAGSSGSCWVGFENWNAIWRYDHGFTRAERAATPASMRRWPPNGGSEAIARLADGSFLVFSEQERQRRRPGRQALWFDRDPTLPKARFFRFRFIPPPAQVPTDAAELPDGRILVLTRGVTLWGGWRAALVILDRKAIRPGAGVPGTVIARLDQPLPRDNYEALAVTRESGRTIVWVASDDNQSMFQRSLLLKFELHPAQLPAPEGR